MEHLGRKSTSVRQTELLIQFMEGHRDLALGRVRSKEARAVSGRLWEQCAEILNSEGVLRTTKEWSRFWNDYKCRVRAKLTLINKDFRGTGGGPSVAPQLTELEDRVASLIGRDAGPLTGVRRDPVMDAQIQFVDIEENQSIVQQYNSPVLDTSLVMYNISPQPSPASSRTVTLEPESNQDTLNIVDHPTTLPQEMNVPTVEETDPPPTPREPDTLSQSGRARNGRRQILRPRARRTIHQSNTAALDDARATIARIEELRARTEELTAAANLKHADAALKIAEALTTIAQAVIIIANRNN